MIIKGGLDNMTFQEYKDFLLANDKDCAEEFEKLRPRYEIISQIIEARTSQNITQEELAKRIGTQKSNISRLESGNYNPTIDFLNKVCIALGKKLTIHIK